MIYHIEIKMLLSRGNFKNAKPYTLEHQYTYQQAQNRLHRRYFFHQSRRIRFQNHLSILFHFLILDHLRPHLRQLTAEHLLDLDAG